MKFISVIILSFFLFACTPLPGGGGINGPKIKAKVIRITCASTVIQILDPNFYSLGETWIINGTGDTIEHAVYVINKCEFPDSLTVGKEFYFKKIPESDARHDCMMCMMYDYPPDKGIYLKVVN